MVQYYVIGMNQVSTNPLSTITPIDKVSEEKWWKTKQVFRHNKYRLINCKRYNKQDKEIMDIFHAYLDEKPHKIQEVINLWCKAAGIESRPLEHVQITTRSTTINGKREYHTSLDDINMPKIGYTDINLSMSEREEIMEELEKEYCEQDRKVMGLYFQGYSIRRICDHINFSFRRVKSIVKRIRQDKKVKKSLEDIINLLMTENIKPGSITHYPENLSPANNPCLVTKYGKPIFFTHIDAETEEEDYLYELECEKYSYTTPPNNTTYPCKGTPSLLFLSPLLSTSFLSFLPVLSSLEVIMEEGKEGCKKEEVIVQVEETVRERLKRKGLLEYAGAIDK